MSDFDDLLERLVMDPAFAGALAADPQGVLRGYQLSDDERAVLCTQVGADPAAQHAVEVRANQSSMFGMLTPLAGVFGGMGDQIVGGIEQVAGQSVPADTPMPVNGRMPAMPAMPDAGPVVPVAPDTPMPGHGIWLAAPDTPMPGAGLPIDAGGGGAAGSAGGGSAGSAGAGHLGAAHFAVAPDTAMPRAGVMPDLTAEGIGPAAGPASGVGHVVAAGLPAMPEMPTTGPIEGVGPAAGPAGGVGHVVAAGLPANPPTGTVYRSSGLAGLGDRIAAGLNEPQAGMGAGQPEPQAGFGNAPDPRAGLGAAPSAPVGPPEGYRTRVDVDGDGRWDDHVVVGRADGGVDIYVDRDGDRRADFVGHDDDADGLVDSADYDKNSDGFFEKTMYDDDGDGWMDRSVRHRK